MWSSGAKLVYMSWDPREVRRVKCLYAPVLQGKLRPSLRFSLQVPLPGSSVPHKRGWRDAAWFFLLVFLQEQPEVVPLFSAPCWMLSCSSSSSSSSCWCCRPSPGRTAPRRSAAAPEHDEAAAPAAARPAAAAATAVGRRGRAGLPQQAVGAGGRGAQQPAHHLEPEWPEFLGVG